MPHLRNSIQWTARADSPVRNGRRPAPHEGAFLTLFPMSCFTPSSKPLDAPTVMRIMKRPHHAQQLKNVNGLARTLAQFQPWSLQPPHSSRNASTGRMATAHGRSQSPPVPQSPEPQAQTTQSCDPPWGFESIVIGQGPPSRADPPPTSTKTAAHQHEYRGLHHHQIHDARIGGAHAFLAISLVRSFTRWPKCWRRLQLPPTGHQSDAPNEQPNAIKNGRTHRILLVVVVLNPRES